jgi:hypothetical protein
MCLGSLSMAFLKKSIRAVCVLRRGVDLSLLGREGQDKVSGEITRKRSMRQMPPTPAV